MRGRVGGRVCSAGNRLSFKRTLHILHLEASPRNNSIKGDNRKMVSCHSVMESRSSLASFNSVRASQSGHPPNVTEM